MTKAIVEIKLWFTESKSFSLSTVSKSRFNFKKSFTSNMSLLEICQMFRCPAKTLETSFMSTLSTDISFQTLISHLVSHLYPPTLQT